jgi:signal transduction histidine kinase
LRSLASSEMILVVAIALLALASAVLVTEYRRRRTAEAQSHFRLLELIHLSQSATVSALSASIGHELNQPLSAMRNNAEAAELILQGAKPDLNLVRQILADIREDDQRASDIIVRLRGLLRKQSAINWQEFDVNDVVGSVGHILRAEAGRRHVDLVLTLAAGELKVRADRVHIQQVIISLATNAMEAMPDATAALRQLTFETNLLDGLKVQVSLADTGPGIPTDHLVGVFDAYYTTKPTGMGLGLPIARAIVELYGGRLWANNRPGGGAVMRFVLPLAPSG